MNEVDTTNKIREWYRKKITEVAEEYAERIKDWISENKLDGDVIRVKDGKRGVIKVLNGFRSTSIFFYPYKKDGGISMNGETQYILSTEAFIPANSGEGEKHEI